MLLTIMTTPENGDCAEDVGGANQIFSQANGDRIRRKQYECLGNVSDNIFGLLGVHRVFTFVGCCARHSRHGKQPELQMQGDARLAIRGLFLDMQYSDQAASAFWLAAVFNKLTTPEYRPKFFMLLFLDPVEANGKRTLDWRRMVTEVKNIAVEWSLPIEKVVEEPILKLFTWLSLSTFRKTLLVEFVKANANHYAECLNAGLYQNVQCELLAQEKIRTRKEKKRTEEELNILTPTQPSFVPSSNQSIVLSSYHRGVRLVRDEFQERESLDVLSDTFMDRPTSDTYGASKEGSRLDVSSYVQDTLLGVTSLTQHLSSGSEGIDHDEMEFPRKRDSPQSMRHRKKFYGDDTMQGPFSTTAVADTVRRRLPASPLLTTAELPLPHKRVRTRGRTKIEHSKTTKKTPIKKSEKLNVDDPYAFKDDEEETIKLASTRAKTSTTLHQRSMPSPMDTLSEIPQPHQRTGELRAKSKIKFMAEKLTNSPNQQTKKQALETVHDREAERHTSKKVEGQKGLENDGKARKTKGGNLVMMILLFLLKRLSVAISSIITDQFDLVQPLGGELLPHSKFLKIRSSQGSTAQSSLLSNVKFSKSKNKLQPLTNAKRKNEEEKL
ncbi:unnamed protein product, partial [Mesorhabditis belari]|uniref:Uncharacterized protein n=1 Tax=Mesorhabditis belari TaxID=2138241 RepID=A0AAF3EDD8_9BILA